MSPHRHALLDLRCMYEKKKYFLYDSALVLLLITLYSYQLHSPYASLCLCDHENQTHFYTYGGEPPEVVQRRLSPTETETDYEYNTRHIRGGLTT